MSTKKPGTIEKFGDLTAIRQRNSVTISTSIKKFKELQYQASGPIDEIVKDDSKYIQVFALEAGKDPVLRTTLKTKLKPKGWSQSIFTNHATGTRFAEWRRSHIEDDTQVEEVWRQDLPGAAQPDRNKATLYSETERGSDGSSKLWNYQQGFIATKGRANGLSSIQKFDPTEAKARRQEKVFSPFKTLFREDLQHSIAEQAERLEPAKDLSAFRPDTKRVNKIFRHASDMMLFSSGFATAFKRASEFVNGKRKLNILDLASSGVVLETIDPQQANVIAGNYDGKPLPEPQVGVNPTGLRLIDNSKPINLADNSQDIITMGRGLCFCKAPPNSSRENSCGGIPGTLEGMTQFLMENARVLNKENPHAIALLHGGVARQNGLLAAQMLKLAERAAGAVMEKYPVEITFVYARATGMRDHIVIQPKALAKKERRAYLASLMKDPPKTLIPLRALEKRAAQMSGYRRVVVNADSPAQSRAILNEMISHLERHPFTPKEIEWHRGTNLVIGKRAPRVLESDLHYLHIDTNEQASTKDNWGALAPALDKLRWDGNPSHPKYKRAVNYPWKASDDPPVASKSEPPPSKKTKAQYHREQKRVRAHANDSF